MAEETRRSRALDAPARFLVARCEAEAAVPLHF
jgi:hypothetical protein